MSAVAFDTLKLARKLRDTAQMTQAQAEGVADALAEAMSGAELATKGDLAATEAALKHEIAEVEHRLETSILEAKAELKADIAAVKGELKADIAAVKGEIAAVKGDIAAVKGDILKAVMGMIIGTVAVNSLAVLGAMFGLAKLLGH